MNSQLPNLTFPWMAKFSQTAKEAREAGLAMVLAGPPKSGKTHLLEIERESIFETEQRVFMCRLQREPDALRQIQLLCYRLVEDSLPKDWRLHSLGYMARFLSRRLVRSDHGLVILTNCQEASEDFFNVIFDVLAEARYGGHKCGLILAGTGDIASMEDLTHDRVACIRQYVAIPPLSHGDIAACLNAWCKEGADLVSRAKSESESESDAMEVLHLVAGSTAGNINRVKLFAEIKNHKFAGKAFTPGLVKDVFSEMRAGAAVSAKK